MNVRRCLPAKFAFLAAALGCLFASSVSFALVTIPAEEAVLYFEDQSLLDYQRSLFRDSGYRIEPNNLSTPVYYRENVRRLFAAAEPLRGKLGPNKIPKLFRPIVADIERLIRSTAMPNNESFNKIDNHHLAAKIVLLAFCFENDPYGLAAMIWKESRFDQSQVSPTGAIGLTQMTGIAIDEVNDQLGNRGENGAKMENMSYWRKSVLCYTGGQRFRLMFGRNNPIPDGKLVDKDAKLKQLAKQWLLADVDRQLIYGQIVLKTLLSHAKSRPGISNLSAYQIAMRNYNGDRKNGRDRIYSREVIERMQSF